MVSSFVDLFSSLLLSVLEFRDVLLFFFAGLTLTTIVSLVTYIVKGKF